MNGFGKMFSYFFLDIAWWYYQYQRGKKTFKLPWLTWVTLLLRKSFLIGDVFSIRLLVPQLSVPLANKPHLYRNSWNILSALSDRNSFAALRNGSVFLSWAVKHV